MTWASLAAFKFLTAKRIGSILSKSWKKLSPHSTGRGPRTVFIEYVPWNPAASSREVVRQANVIINDLQSQGYDLTLRQLYYQFVSKGLLENKQTEYKRLGDIINKARLAGLVSWEAVVDRTRNVSAIQSWDDEAQIVSLVADQFRTDRWDRQPVRLEVWIEKEALAGVFQRICTQLHVPFFACRGYPSQSSVWRASRRLGAHIDSGQEVVVLHFGDHDPSGMDMTSDIRNRLERFGLGMTLHRMALNMDQVRQYDPPPNPAKMSDSRASGYVLEYGNESWELDALEPSVLADLVRTQVEAYRDDDLESRRVLRSIADNYDDVKFYLGH